MLKFVYVLICSENDYYFEQWLMSVYSLKYKMPDAFVSIAIDKDTDKFINENYKETFNDFVNEKKIVDLPEDLSKKEKSRFIKTTLRKHITGDYLFLDCDTIIAEDLSEIKNWDFDIGCALDTHLQKEELMNEFWKNKAKQMNDVLNFDLTNNDNCNNYYFNSGVIYCKDNEKTHNFYEEWHRLWIFSKEKGIFIDQPAFYRANYLCDGIINEINGKYNAQILAFNGINFLSDAKILHYYSSIFSKGNVTSAYIPAQIETLYEIRKNKKIPQKIIEMIKNPKQAFITDAMLLSMQDCVNYCSGYKLISVLLRRILIRIPSLRKFIVKG